jgi:hypothetical protein
VLLDLREGHAGSVALGLPAATGAQGGAAWSHLVLEDRAGVRWVDFHPGASGSTRVILPRVSWNGPGFYLRSLATNTEYSVPVGADVNLAQLTPRAPALLHRGAIHDAFTHLFELAFDQAALDALPLDEELGDRAAAAPPGADLSAPSSWQRIAASSTNGLDRAQLNQEIGTRNRWTAITGIGGAALTAAGLGLLLWRW